MAQWFRRHRHQASQIGGGFVSEVITLTPGSLTGSVVLPAGAVLLPGTTVLRKTAWDGGATMNLGDGGSATGYLSALDLTAGTGTFTLTDAPWALNVFDGGPLSDAFNACAYYATEGSGYLYGPQLYYPAGGTITATVTATDPTVGETKVLVVYVVPV